MTPRRLARLLLVLLLAGGIAWALTYRESLDSAALVAQVRSYGLWAPMAFVAVFALATVLFLPGSVFALGAIVKSW